MRNFSLIVFNTHLYNPESDSFANTTVSSDVEDFSPKEFSNLTLPLMCSLVIASSRSVSFTSHVKSRGGLTCSVAVHTSLNSEPSGRTTESGLVISSPGL